MRRTRHGTPPAKKIAFFCVYSGLPKGHILATPHEHLPSYNVRMCACGLSSNLIIEPFSHASVFLSLLAKC